MNTTDPAPIIRHIVADFQGEGVMSRVLTLPPRLQRTAARMPDSVLLDWITDNHGSPCSWSYLTTAISVQQPWAWAIIEAGKDVENRSRAIARSGWHYLHAGKTLDNRNYHRAAAIVRELNDTPHLPIFAPPPRFRTTGSPSGTPIAMPPSSEMQTGGIIGAIHISHWTDTSQSPWFFGPKAAVINAALPLAFIPCLGKLGAFRPTFP